MAKYGVFEGIVMAEPKQKSLELPSFLTRHIPVWTHPDWLTAQRWRTVVQNQPIAMDCEITLLADVTSTQWQIRAKQPNEEDILADDIEAYTDVLNPPGPGALDGFDIWINKVGQDLLTLPIGGNTEVIRWPGGMGPFSRSTSKGHVWQLAYIDGATLVPTFDLQFPMMQKLREDVTNAIFFERGEIMRMVSRPRTPMRLWGFGMAPPEKIFLAINMLYRSDTYYANLLLDTPEAGLLDLMDMSKDDARDWLSSFRGLFEGIDPYKIGVLYQHTQAAKYLPFTRPPTEMMLDKSTEKYAQITAAGYGLTLTDIGLGAPQKTLAGSIRDERKSRRSGFLVTREIIKNAINQNVMPDYLEFVWVENDEEAKIQRGRSFLLNAQAVAKAKEAGFITKREGQQQLIKDGHITVEVEEPEEFEIPPMLPANINDNNDELDKKDPSQGGKGDITGKADLGDTKISAVPRNSATFDQMKSAIQPGFEEIILQANDADNLLPLIRAATEEMFPDVTQAFLAELSDYEIELWKSERLKMWFENKSEFDDFPDVLKAKDDALEQIDKLLEENEWWLFPAGQRESIEFVLRQSFAEGATLAAELIQDSLFRAGVADSPDLIGFSFNLKNPRTLAQLENKAATLVTQVDDGTKFFLKRIITSGVDEGLSSPEIATMIKDGAGLEDILADTNFTSNTAKIVQSEIQSMAESRVTSIVNTEVARAESEGRVGQWSEMGLTQKQWVHTGGDLPCVFCQRNIDEGFVPMDFMFDSVFGRTTLGPPAHPKVDHCHIAFSEAELFEKADTLEVWTGE